MRTPVIAFIALLALPIARGQADEPQVLRPAADDVPIRKDTVLQKGAWNVPDVNANGVLRIETDGVTLDLGRAALVGTKDGADPDTFAGIGIHVIGAKRVTIRNGSIRGFKIGIRAENAPGLVIENVDASDNFRQRLRSTPEREDARDWLRPHDNDKGEWETKYGAGISLTSCPGARVAHCRAGNGQNGLLLTRCARCTAYANDFSFNSGWGIALYRSSRCRILRNRCDWCVRGYSHGVYHRGQDSAGILLFEQSSENLVVGNSATHGGDGFFLYAGHDTTERKGTGGSNKNLVFDNDFSHAVANGIEATFSVENTFVRNDCSDSDHGIWAGYSRDSLFGGNKVETCKTAGVSIEHGQGNRIVANRISRCPKGVHLWWDRDVAFVDGVFGEKNDTSSRRSTIQGNDILSCDTAVFLDGDTETQVRWNVLHGKQVLLDFGPKTRPGLVAHNLLRGSRSRTRPAPLAIRDRSGSGWSLPPQNQRRGYLKASPGFDPQQLEEAVGILRPPSRLPQTPEAEGKGRLSLPEDMPRGRKEIRIGTWGPLDPRLTHAFPSTQLCAGGEAAVHLTGSGPFRVAKVEGDVEVDAMKGELPATLRVRVLPLPGGAGRSSIVPFRLVCEASGMELEARGTLLEAEWRVAWHEWSVDPRKGDAFSGAAKVTRQVRALDFPWQSKGPDGVRADRFATRAETVLRLKQGRYRVRTVSDDGIRVRIGDRLVIDNWTHHAPTEDVAEVDLPAGDHVVRVEHFELDGWAHLSLRIERLPDD